MDRSTRGVNLCLAGAALLAASVARPAAGDEGPAEGYLVLPFTNISGSPALDPYSGALAQSVAERLEVHPHLRPAYGPEVLPVATPPVSDEDAARLARSAGARWVIVGAFERDADWKIRVEERLLLVSEAAAATPASPPSPSPAPSQSPNPATPPAPASSASPADAVPPAPPVRVLARAEAKGDKDDVQELATTVALDLLGKAARPLPPELAAQARRRLTKDPYAFFLFGKALGYIHGYGKLVKDSKKAEEMLAKMLRIEPTFAEGHRLRGWFYLEEGLPQKARGEYSYALELRKDYYLPLVGLVRMYRASGNRQQAMEHVRRALEIRPWDVESRYLFGQLLYEEGKLDDAYGELKRVVQAQPRHLAARRTLVLIHAARGAGEELAQELEGIVALEPDDLDGRLDLGSAYQRIGEIDKAIAAYQAVLDRRPRHVAATKFLADLYRTRGDYDKAAELYRSVMRMAPQDPRPYFLLGATYVQAGRDGKAESVFQQAQQFHKYSADAWNNLGAIYYRRGDISRALFYLERAVQKLPQRSKVHYNLGLALSAARERDRALGELRTAATLDPDDAEIRYALGVVLLRMGKLDDAAKEFREAVARRPDHQDARHNLALLEELARRVGENEIISPALVGEPPPAPGAPDHWPRPPGFQGPEPPPGFRPK
jgi:tetratricopeptide (TPR) repeat protein